MDSQGLTAWGLGVVAVAVTAAGKAKRGARLLGVADRACEVMGVTPTPAGQPENDRARARLAQELEPIELETLMAEGRAMTRPEAVTYVLEEGAPPSSAPGKPPIFTPIEAPPTHPAASGIRQTGAGAPSRWVMTAPECLAAGSGDEGGNDVGGVPV